MRYFTKKQTNEKVYIGKMQEKRGRKHTTEKYSFEKTDCRPARKIRFPQDGSLLCIGLLKTYFFAFLMQVKRLSYS